MNDFDLLHHALQYHIVNSLGWQDLRPFQKAAIRPILNGRHLLILAPTAGGKTEAALFPVMSRMLEADWRRLGILYICPIKALLNNLHTRLGSYFTLLGRRSALWHGDISGAKRRHILHDPPDCLLTTPESLEVILTSRNTDHRTFLADVKVVIIDEIHAFAGDERGWHLLAVLERISRLAGGGVQRIGLSATVGNPDALAGWLTGGGNRPCAVQKPPGNGDPTADITLDFVGSLDNAAIVISRLHRGEKRLVFVDSRAKAEQLGARLRHLNMAAHVIHSSLSADQRRQAEKAFTEAEDCVIVATSVLELGMDIGDLDRVIQIDAPRTVGSFLQRMGRTGRRPGTRRNALFLATSEDALLHAAALIRLWAHGYVEPLNPPALPYHVFAQQLMALALQESGIGKTAWHEWINGFCKIAGLTKEAVEALIDYMITADLLWDDHGILWFGQKGEKEFGYRHFMEILSLVAGDPLFSVRCGNQDLGVVHPISFQTAGGGSATILLGGRSWRVTFIDWPRKTAYVESTTSPGRSRWLGGGMALGYDVCQSVRNLLESTEVSSFWSRRAAEKIAAIRDDMPWFKPGNAVFVFNNGVTRWWTFAGDPINKMLCILLKEHLQIHAQSASFAVLIRCDLQPSTARSMIDKLKALCQTDEKFPVDDDLLNGLKFSQCLPKELAREVIRERLVDRETLRTVVTVSDLQFTI